MDFTFLNKDNIDKEHICCTLSKNHSAEIAHRKKWLKQHFSDGLVFKKLPVHGKVFIEYVPAEKAWRPVIAGGYMFIHCLWVSGRYKGCGNAKALLNECIKDAEGMNGVAVVTSSKSFLTDKAFFLKQGFELCDTAPPYFELLALRLKKDAPIPVFTEKSKTLLTDRAENLVIYYSNQCPYFESNAVEMKQTAEEAGLSVSLIKHETADEAQKSACAHGTFYAFLNGKFLTHKPYTAEQFKKLLDKNR